MTEIGMKPEEEALNPLNPEEQTLNTNNSEKKKKTAEDRGEIFRALEIVERNSSAIAESYASLFSSLRLALSEVNQIRQTALSPEKKVVGVCRLPDLVNLAGKYGLEVTSNSVENMQCFSDVVGSLQVAALDAATKGNRYINSCLRLNEELKSMESLALELPMKSGDLYMILSGLSANNLILVKERC